MRKPRILIADDDTMVRIGLKTVINWEENGFVLVGEAANGLEAMQLVQKKKPDIVITDIKMPGMDGIELIRQLREAPDTPEILVLSSYDEFELVKQALKLGARDYLLKLNLNPEELLHSLRTILSETAAEAPLFSGDDEKSRALLRQNFLWDVVSNYYMNGQELAQSMRKLDIHLEARPVYCMIIKVGEVYRFEEATAEEIQTLRISVINITEEIVNDVCCGYCFTGRTGEFDVLLTAEEALTEEAVLRLARRLRKMLHEYLELSCTIVVGSSMQEGEKGIKEAFWRANAAVSQRFYAAHDGVLLWQQDMEQNRQDRYSLSAVRAELNDILVSGTPEELARVFDRLRTDIHRLSLSRSTVRAIALELLYIVQDYCERNELPVQSILKNSCCGYEKLMYIETLTEMLDWLAALQRDLSEFLMREGDKGNARIVNMAQDWIAAHYRETASLQEAARAVSLNPSYFSTILKKTTGKSYTELLMEYRIERAKELLLMTDAKVYRVGQMVGYEDKFYFSRLFKRVTGTSPGEFKNQSREG